MGKNSKGWAIAVVVLALLALIGSCSRGDSNSGNNSGSKRCSNCGGDGWDSTNNCSCVWCGGDGKTSWNP